MICSSVWCLHFMPEYPSFQDSPKPHFLHSPDQRGAIRLEETPRGNRGASGHSSTIPGLRSAAIFHGLR
jgi:hypothetical protein